MCERLAQIVLEIAVGDISSPAPVDSVEGTVNYQTKLHATLCGCCTEAPLSVDVLRRLTLSLSLSSKPPSLNLCMLYR